MGRKVGKTALDLRRANTKDVHKLEIAKRRERQSAREPDPEAPQPKRKPNVPSDKAVSARIVERAKVRRVARQQTALYNQMRQQEGRRV